jgi:hypothetical protein
MLWKSRTKVASARYAATKNRGKPYLDNHKRWSDVRGVVTFFICSFHSGDC